MPRIDPQQLLKTLGVLLAPTGGIKSSEEVVRLVTLMHKFSKKLVSKCIYVQILRATTTDLLEHFLDEKGWDLLNVWFADAIKSQNWPFCVEMIQLFAICPISATRLKDNVEVNQAPRLINQLRLEPSISHEVRQLATDVYEKWVAVVSPAQETKEEVQTDEAMEEQDSQVENADQNNLQPSLSLLASLANEVSENIKKEENKEKEEKAKKSRKDSVDKDRERDRKKDHDRKSSSSKDHKSSSRDKDRDKEREAERKRKREKEKEREKEKDSSSSRHRDERERKRPRPDRRDEVAPDEKQRIKEIARRMKEETQSKKDKDTLTKLAGFQPSAISKMPKIPKKPVDKKGTSFEDMLGGLDSKPKSVKTPHHKNKTAALLEGLTKSSSSSSSSSSKSSSSKTSSYSSSSKREDRHHRDGKDRHHHSSSSSRKESSSSSSSSSRSKYDNKPASLIFPVPDSSSSKRSSTDMESPKAKSSSSPKNVTESRGFMDAIFGVKNKEEPRKKKRRLSETEYGKKLSEKAEEKSDTSENKKSPKIEEAKEKENEPAAPSAPPAFSFYRDTLDEVEDKDKSSEGKEERPRRSTRELRSAAKKNYKESGSESEEETEKEEKRSDEKEEEKEDKRMKKESPEDDDIPFEQPDDMPREVKGILVYHRGSEKRNKSIQWKAETDLVAVKYFEMDEGERVNVNRIKFENMRDMELKMEKEAHKKLLAQEEEAKFKWYKPLPIDVTNREPFTPGEGSEEKEIQSSREKGVLQAIYFTPAMIPPSPAEPDSESVVRKEPAVIPLDDKEAGDENDYDYTQVSWPELKVSQVDQQTANFESTFSLPPALSNLLKDIPNITPAPPLSQEEQDTLAAQTEAMKAMGMLPGIDIPPAFPPPVKGPPGMPQQQPHMDIPPPNMGGPPPFNGPPPFEGGNFDGPPPFQNGGPPGPHLGNFDNGNNGGPGFYNDFRGGPRGGGGFHRGGFGGNRGGGDFDGGRRGNNGRGGPGGYNNQRGFNRRGGGGDNRGFRDFRGNGNKSNNDKDFYKTRHCAFYDGGNGYCRDGDRCKFIHEDFSNGGNN